jgi:hypothetical protein
MPHLILGPLDNPAFCKLPLLSLLNITIVCTCLWFIVFCSLLPSPSHSFIHGIFYEQKLRVSTCLSHSFWHSEWLSTHRSCISESCS